MDEKRPTPSEALELAKEQVGGPAKLARALGGVITSQAISQWERVPAERVLEVERATGVPRDQLRPDIYPPQEAA
jgi:DNA-binding transcriptional regulator YdaS (Cro superfamily)